MVFDQSKVLLEISEISDRRQTKDTSPLESTCHMPVDEPSPSSSVPNHPDDPGPIAGLVVLFLIGLSILCAGIYKLDKNRCVHIPFGSLSFTLIFLYSALEKYWLIALLCITIFLWVLVTVIYHCAHRSKHTLDSDDRSLNRLDDGL